MRLDDLFAAVLGSVSEAVIAVDSKQRVLRMNPMAESLTGWGEREAKKRDFSEVYKVVDQTDRSLLETVVSRALREEREALRTNQSLLISKEGLERLVDERATPIRSERGEIVGCVLVFRNESERRRIDTRQSFLANLASAVEPLEDPNEVILVTARQLAEFLGVDRCAYAEVENQTVFCVTGDHSRGGLPSIVGRWPVAAFGRECFRQMLANEPYVVTDTENDRRIDDEDREAYEATNIRSVICIPLHKNGIFTAAMAVHQKDVRHWSMDDIELVRLVVGRCWESLERARTARRLVQSEERLRVAVDAADIGTWDLDPLTGALKWSERCNAIFGFPPNANVSYEIFLERLHPDDRLVTEQTVQKAFAPEGNGSYNIDYRVVWPDGTLRWVAASGEAFFSGPGPNRHAVRFVGTVLDITERKLAEEALRVSEEFNRTILESTPDCIKILDANGQLLMMNRHGLDLMEIADYGSMKGKEWSSLLPETESERFKSALAAAARGETDRFQAHYPTLKGKQRWWDIVVAPVRGQKGEIERIIVVTRDVSVQKEAEDKLRDAATRLADADRRKDEFIAILAHELRNPLAPIRTGLEVMKLAKDDPAMIEEVRCTMERQTQQLIALVDDLLDVSRITRGKLELRKSKVKLGEVLKSAVEASRPLIDAARHRLEVSAPADQIALEADPHRLAQVVSNLLNNAAKYTPDGGEIHLGAELIGTEVELSVRDNGIGIPADMLDRVFDMFAQIEPSKGKVYTGLGIGLTLVKTIVEMHQGRVEVESAGEGSVFRIFLPILSESGLPDAFAGEANGERVGSRPRRKVLVVDDNKDAADTLGVVVKMLGNEVRIAEDGERALAVASEFKPEVIFMDLGMPKMDGCEAARRLRGFSWGRDVLLVALTGWGQEEDRRRTHEAGFDVHLVKPADPSEVERLLNAGQSKL